MGDWRRIQWQPDAAPRLRHDAASLVIATGVDAALDVRAVLPGASVACWLPTVSRPGGSGVRLCRQRSRSGRGVGSRDTAPSSAV